MRSLIAVVVGLAVGIAAAIGLGAVLLSAAPPVVHVSPAPSPSPAAAASAGICVAPGSGSSSGSPCAVASLAPAPSSPSATPTAPSSEPSGSGGPTASANPSGSVSPSVSAAPSRATSPFPLVGQLAPSLAAPGVDGPEVDLASLRGRPVWVVFIGTYYPSVRDQYVLMNTLLARNSSAGLAVVAVHVKESSQAVSDFLASVDAPFSVALDADGSLAQAWQADVLPFHYFIDAQGVIRSAAVGGIDAATATASLATILPKPSPTPTASPSP